MTGEPAAHDPALTGWTPIRVSPHADGPVVDWCYTAGVRFDDPFFDQTVERCLRHPFRLLFRRSTPIDVAGTVAAARGNPRPSGIVFHLSRSGSTLVARMLGARADTVALSEPGPVDTVVRAPAPLELRARWLRWIVAALRPDGDEAHYVLKLDAWTALDIDVVERAFPDVPVAFVYRDPVEVLVSQAAQRGYHTVPFALPPERLGLSADDVATLPQHEYPAAVIGRIADALAAAAERAMATGSRRTILVNHAELPAAVAERVAPHFGMPVDEPTTRAMLAVAGSHAKNPALGYADDSAHKRAAASDELRAAAHTWISRPYETLERLRARAR